MTFEHSWVLIFLLAPLAWMFFEWTRTRRTLALALKTVAFVAIILALAEPKYTLPETKMAVAVLVDTSASVSPQDLTRASQLASTLEERGAVTGSAYCPSRDPFAILRPPNKAADGNCSTRRSRQAARQNWKQRSAKR